MGEPEQTPGDRVIVALLKREMSLLRLVQGINDQRWWNVDEKSISRNDLVDFIDYGLPAFAEGDRTVSSLAIIHLANALRVDAKWLLHGTGEPPETDDDTHPLVQSMARGLEDRFGSMIDGDQCTEIANTALRFIEANSDVGGSEGDASANDFVQALFAFMYALNFVLGAPMDDEGHKDYLWRVLDILDAMTPGLKGGTIETTKAMRRVVNAVGWQPDGPQKPLEKWD